MPRNPPRRGVSIVRLHLRSPVYIFCGRAGVLHFQKGQFEGIFSPEQKHFFVRSVFQNLNICISPNVDLVFGQFLRIAIKMGFTRTLC